VVIALDDVRYGDAGLPALVQAGFVTVAIWPRCSASPPT
jgi:hypothetical protein